MSDDFECTECDSLALSPELLCPICVPELVKEVTGKALDLKAPAPYRVVRPNDRDLMFTGWCLGMGDLRLQNNVEIHSRIYLTVTGKIVTSTAFSTKDLKIEVHSGATLEECMDKALVWMKKTNKGRLGPSSKTAWTQACNVLGIKETEVV